MGFAQEMDDFISAFDAGTRIRYNISQRIKLESDTARRPSDEDVAAVPSSMGEGPGSVGETSAPQVTSGGELTDAERKARRDGITAIESGGNYRAVGREVKGDRAYGRYQVMGNNVGPWTQKYLGKKMTPGEFLANDAAQDAVFDGEFDTYVRKYGLENAAQAWFGGEGSIGNVDADDPNGMTIGKYGKIFLDGYNKSLKAGGGAPAVAKRGAIPEDEEKPFEGANAADLLEPGAQDDGSTSESPEIAVVAAPGEETGEAPQVEGDFDNPYAQTGLYRRGGAIPEEGF